MVEVCVVVVGVFEEWLLPELLQQTQSDTQSVDLLVPQGQTQRLWVCAHSVLRHRARQRLRVFDGLLVRR